MRKRTFAADRGHGGKFRPADPAETLEKKPLRARDGFAIGGFRGYGIEYGIFGGILCAIGSPGMAMP